MLKKVNCCYKRQILNIFKFTLFRKYHHNSYVFSLIADETSNISNREQVSIYICCCISSLESNKVFLGFFETHRTGSNTLFCLVKNAFVKAWFGYFLSSWKGYDGGSNMVGKINGLQKMIQENLKALYFHSENTIIIFQKIPSQQLCLFPNS